MCSEQMRTMESSILHQPDCVCGASKRVTRYRSATYSGTELFVRNEKEYRRNASVEKSNMIPCQLVPCPEQLNKQRRHITMVQAIRIQDMFHLRRNKHKHQMHLSIDHER
jgi:hypothetical protein